MQGWMLVLSMDSRPPVHQPSKISPEWEVRTEVMGQQSPSQMLVQPNSSVGHSRRSISIWA